MGTKIDTKQNDMTPFNFDRLHESQGDKWKKKEKKKNNWRLAIDSSCTIKKSTSSLPTQPSDEAAYVARLQQLHHTLWHVYCMRQQSWHVCPFQFELVSNWISQALIILNQ